MPDAPVSNTPTTLAQLLEELEAGVFEQRCMVAIRDTSLGTVISGKKGKVVITLEMKRIGESNQVELKHTVAFQRPTKNGKQGEEYSSSTPMHVGNGGRITLMPDTQLKMFGEDGARLTS